MDKIGLVAGFVARPAGQGAYPLAAVSGQPATRPAPAQSPAAEAEAPRLSAFSRLWQHKDQAVGELRAAGEQQRRVEAADRLVTEIRQQIGGLVKNYPPFPPGSEERLSYLRSISALRQQLDALTVPPAIERAEPLPKAPPLPPDSATDAEWGAHAEALVAYGESLSRLRTELAEAIARPALWPEIAAAPPATAGIGLDAMQRAIDGLRLSAAPLSHHGNLTDAGLV